MWNRFAKVTPEQVQPWPEPQSEQVLPPAQMSPLAWPLSNSGELGLDEAARLAEQTALEEAIRDRRDRYRARRRQQSRRLGWFLIGGFASAIATGIYLNGKQAPALAEAPGAASLVQYAEAVMGIEPLRQTAYSEVQKQFPGQSVPIVLCSQPDTIRPLPRDAKAIIVDYCNQAKAIIEGTGLNVGLFNQISQTHQVDPIVKQRIQDELIRLQQPR